MDNLTYYKISSRIYLFYAAWLYAFVIEMWIKSWTGIGSLLEVFVEGYKSVLLPNSTALQLIIAIISFVLLTGPVFYQPRGEVVNVDEEMKKYSKLFRWISILNIPIAIIITLPGTLFYHAVIFMYIAELLLWIGIKMHLKYKKLQETTQN